MEWGVEVEFGQFRYYYAYEFAPNPGAFWGQQSEELTKIRPLPRQRSTCVTSFEGRQDT